jgi:hypothetical protein
MPALGLEGVAVVLVLQGQGLGLQQGLVEEEVTAAAEWEGLRCSYGVGRG